MNPDYLADAWYFIAQIDRFDQHYRAATNITNRLRNANLITHAGVIAEVLAFFSCEGAHARIRAADWAREAYTRYKVVPNERDLVLRAIDLYKRRFDKEYSLADCISMTIMRDRNITHVLTNDHHFRQEGFTVVNE